MKTPRNLGLAAIVVFVISHFLPAYGNISGFACFRVCWDTLLDRNEILSAGWFYYSDRTEILSAGWFYYSGFVISNILFIGLVMALFMTKKSRRLRSVISVVFFLHVLSW